MENKRHEINLSGVSSLPVNNPNFKIHEKNPSFHEGQSDTESRGTSLLGVETHGVALHTDHLAVDSDEVSSYH